MATPFSDVYGFFTRKVTDYSFINMTEAELNAILYELMQSAVVKFKSCKQNIFNRDDTSFSVDLTDEEKEIIGTLMVVEWLTNKVASTQLLSMVMSDKEFKWSSQAQQLKELRQLRESMEEEANDLIKMYLFDLEGLNDGAD
jgi:hypothetical protein